MFSLSEKKKERKSKNNENIANIDTTKIKSSNIIKSPNSITKILNIQFRLNFYGINVPPFALLPQNNQLWVLTLSGTKENEFTFYRESNFKTLVKYREKKTFLFCRNSIIALTYFPFSTTIL